MNLRFTHLHGAAVHEGNDGIARFTVAVWGEQQYEQARCSHCTQDTTITFKYRLEVAKRLMSRWGLDIKNTMLDKGSAQLCPSCWGKCQRQIIHIITSTPKEK